MKCAIMAQGAPKIQSPVKKVQSPVIKQEIYDDFDLLDEPAIVSICQELVKQEDYQTLFWLTHTKRKFYQVCQPLLIHPFWSYRRTDAEMQQINQFKIEMTMPKTASRGMKEFIRVCKNNPYPMDKLPPLYYKYPQQKWVIADGIKWDGDDKLWIRTVQFKCNGFVIYSVSFYDADEGWSWDETLRYRIPLELTLNSSEVVVSDVWLDGIEPFWLNCTVTQDENQWMLRFRYYDAEKKLTMNIKQESDRYGGLDLKASVVDGQVLELDNQPYSYGYGTIPMLHEIMTCSYQLLSSPDHLKYLASNHCLHLSF
jgi:hypothetical protein